MFVKEEGFTARKEGRHLCSLTLDNFNGWAVNNLQSPRSVWLYSMGFFMGSVYVVLRAAVRYFRNNNVNVAKGAMYMLKGLAWSANLPLYRQCILRSGIAEESQVRGLLGLLLPNFGI